MTREEKLIGEERAEPGLRMGAALDLLAALCGEEQPPPWHRGLGGWTSMAQRCGRRLSEL